jgi:hypothetical protein
MMRIRTMRRMAVVTTLLLSATSPTIVSAELLPWDQAKVTELGRQLAETTSAARQSARREPNLQRGGTNVTQQRSANDFLQTMRQLESSTRQLSRQLEAGSGKDDTMGVARRIGTLLRDAQVSGRSLMLSQIMWEKINPMIEVIDKISPFYSDTSPLRPSPLNRTGGQPAPTPAESEAPAEK